MKIENVVSPIPEGSARSLDFIRHWHTVTGGNFYGRGGSQIPAWDLASNLGFPASSETTALLNGVACLRRRNGVSGSNPFALTPFGGQVGLSVGADTQSLAVWGYECLMNMDVNTAKPVENGVWFAKLTLSRVWNGAASGLGVSRDGNDVRFFQNGPLGVTDQVLTGITPNSWNRYRFVFFMANANRGASFQLWVNGVRRITLDWTDANNMPVMDAVSGALIWQIGFASAGANDWVYYTQQRFFAGPSGPGVL